MRPAGSTSDAAPAREEHPAVVSLVLLAIWAVLTMLQIGLLPPLRYQWGVNFWQYLPGWTVPVLAVLALAPCVPSVRAALVVAAQRTGTVLARPLPFAVLLVATMVVCWLLRVEELRQTVGAVMRRIRRPSP